MTLQITHLTPANETHMQSVLENLHFREIYKGQSVHIEEIRWEEGEKYVDYELI